MSQRQYVLVKSTAPQSHAIPTVDPDTDVPVLNLQRTQDDIGNVQVYIDGGTARVQIEGRIFDFMPWSVIQTVDETDLDSTGTATARIPIYPFMRAHITSGTATTVIAVMTE